MLASPELNINEVRSASRALSDIVEWVEEVMRYHNNRNGLPQPVNHSKVPSKKPACHCGNPNCGAQPRYLNNYYKPNANGQIGNAQGLNKPGYGGGFVGNYGG